MGQLGLSLLELGAEEPVSSRPTYVCLNWALPGACREGVEDLEGGLDLTEGGIVPEMEHCLLIVALPSAPPWPSSGTLLARL